jgi:hypothetical protein
VQDGSASTQLCIPLPAYDVFAQLFAFSTCWRWDCFPDTFKGSDPAVIKVRECVRMCERMWVRMRE